MSIGMLMTEVVVATTKTPVDPDTLGFFISDRVKSSIITPSLIMLPPLRAMAIRLLSTLTVKIPSIIEDLASTLSVKLKPDGNSTYIIPSAGIGLTVVNDTVTLLIVPATNDCGMTLDDVIPLTQELILDDEHEFCGDSFDREIIKEMYLSQLTH